MASTPIPSALADRRSIVPTLLGFLLLIYSVPSLSADRAQTILHLLDYMSVDYPSTVERGRVVNPDEYAEQVEFASQLPAAIKELPARAERSGLQTDAERLHRLVLDKVPGDRVTQAARELAHRVAVVYSVALSPRSVPDAAIGTRLYQARCAQCHGTDGRGDGPLAATLTPPPINFHDASRQSQRSVYSLYSTITLGVAGTAMRGFDDLSDNERWSLAFYVSNFVFTNEQRGRGKHVARDSDAFAMIPNMTALTQLTPAEAQAQTGEDGVAMLAYLRKHPERLPMVADPINVTKTKLAAAIDAYRAGRSDEAYAEAVSAYFDGFELAEAPLRLGASELLKDIEKKMLVFRQSIKSGASFADIEDRYRVLIATLDDAQHRVADRHSSTMGNIVSSAVILLREGLEAILVLAAIMGVLIKTGRRDALPYFHVGWIGALLLGFATWGVSTFFVDIGGANRELTEGLTALLAAAVLVYVGFWLHSKASANRWREFVQNKIQQSLQGRALWALTAIAFLAVYREVFETVLFYQALWLQADSSSHGALWLGAIIGVGLLTLLGWLILRFSVRLPLRLFFAVNSIVLFVLAIAFSGHGITALQEAGLLPIDPLPLPSIGLLGIYPTAESIFAQLVVVGLISAILLRERIGNLWGPGRTP
jgi:high-affinity iron transporter